MIIDLQRRLAEIGRIRIGAQINSPNGKTRPAKLDTFRLTSPDRNRIAQASRLYGGTINKWQAPAGPQWEIITTTNTLPIIVPPSDMAFTQHYELWAAGGCQRRCDGITESLTDGPCLCDPERRDCAIHTRLSVMLRDLPGLGVWRIDTQGYYAAVELQAAVGIVEMAAGRGQMLPATLRLEQRMTKRPDQGTRRFAVPVLDIEIPPGQLISGTAALDPGTIAIEAPAPRPLTPIPADTSSPPSVAEQVAAAETSIRRRRGAQLPATGLAPRTAAQAATVGDTPQAAGAAPADAPTHGEPETGLLVDPPDAAAPAQTPHECTADVHGVCPDCGRTTASTRGEPDELITREQNRKLHALMRELGITTQTDRHALRDHILGYHPEAGLTKTEASRILDTIEYWRTGPRTLDADADYTVEGDDLYPIADRINDILNQKAINQADDDASD